MLPLVSALICDIHGQYLMTELGVHYGNLRIASLLFADDVVLLVSLARNLQHAMEWFAAKCETA